MGTDKITVLLFDKSFGSIGSVSKERLRSMDKPETAQVLFNEFKQLCDDNWTVQEIVKQIKVCRKCEKKFIGRGGCCEERTADQFKKEPEPQPQPETLPQLPSQPEPVVLTVNEVQIKVDISPERVSLEKIADTLTDQIVIDTNDTFVAEKKKQSK